MRAVVLNIRNAPQPLVQLLVLLILLVAHCAQHSELYAQNPPYDIYPKAQSPYYRVRYEGSKGPGKLIFAVNYTIWIPPELKQLRGVVVHQHGCGEGSCKSGLTGAYDLHWQALARKHDCALLAPAYEQPQTADCQMWCDPRNGSAETFLRCLADFAERSGHAELTSVPWALWGHSGGGHWVGGMVMLYPERVIAAWLRSGVPLLQDDPSQPRIRAHQLPESALKVPMICNLGTKEGYSIKNADFAGVWPANEKFFLRIREPGGLIGLAIDPKSSHECGNQRYLAIPWLDACMQLRLPKAASPELLDVSQRSSWLGDHEKIEFTAESNWHGDKKRATWLPSESIGRAWKEYCTDAEVADSTPPPAPTDVTYADGTLTWDALADIESGISKFIVYRDDKVVATVPSDSQNKHGRPIFQGLSYSDTPFQPLIGMSFTETKDDQKSSAKYRVVSVNSVGLTSE